jgi:LysR family nitrogen assimilation transcriptional regulator
MTPRQLKYFVEIARSGSITTAAATLHIAQPALSHHIAAMEEELGVALLQRHARGVRLTMEGQRLFERAASILRQMERLREDVRDASTELRGVVRACIAGSVAPVLVVPLYRLLQERAPEVQLHLTTAMSREAQTLVEARRVDLALLPTASEMTKLESTPAYEEDFCLFGAQALMGDATGDIAFRAIGDRPLVEPDREHDLRKLIERTAVALDCPLNVRYEVNSSDLLRSMVCGGLAFAIMPRNAFPDAKAQHIAVQRIAEPVLSRTQSVVWSMEQPLTPAGHLVRDLLLELIAQMIHDGRLVGRSIP